MAELLLMPDVWAARRLVPVGTLRAVLHGLCVLLLLTAVSAFAQGAKEPVPPDNADAKCIACHFKEAEAIKVTRHGVPGDPRAPANHGGACQSCHGPSQEHAQNVRVKPAVVFNRTAPAEKRSQACLGCHQGAKTMHWAGAAHARNDVACDSCHQSHRAADPVKVASTQAGVCFDCHKAIRAATLRLSTHPMRSGWMPCSSCHNSHGSVGEAELVRASVNQTCYTCHAEKRGPFLWPHQPSSENCSNCHEPHGTNNAPMLVSRMPYLCSQCHLTPQHGSNLQSGSNLPPAVGGASMLGAGCANCHMKVHGSNHPSGSALTR